MVLGRGLAFRAIGRALPRKIAGSPAARGALYLILVAVPFTIGQVRGAIYPALEEPFAWRAAVGAGGIGRAELRQEAPMAPEADEVAREEKSVVRGMVSGVVGGALGGVEGSLNVPSPRRPELDLESPRSRSADRRTDRARIVLGWREVSLAGAARSKDQRLRLILVPPANRLAFLPVGLLLVLASWSLDPGRGVAIDLGSGTGRALLA
jgi:hypothetical protein